MLIFLEGSWETLPFEIRLLRPWYGSEFCDRNSLTTAQRLDIAAQGYCIADQHEKAAPDPTESEGGSYSHQMRAPTRR